MKRIIISEDKLNLINEGLSDLLYHFTSWQNGLKICESNVIYLQSAFAKDADNYDKKRKFYLSCTRIRNASFGYSKKFNYGGVRIVLDGEKLSHRFKGKPINYWSGLGDKYKITKDAEEYGKNYTPDSSWDVQRFKTKNPNATDKEINDFAAHNFNRSAQEHIGNESEDRIFSYEPALTNAYDYIISIDVLLPVDSEKNERDAIARAFWSSKLSAKVKIYASQEEFNNPNGKTLTFDDISYASKMSLPYDNDRGMYSSLRCLQSVIAFIAYGNSDFGTFANSYNIDKNKFFTKVRKLLKQYELSEFSKHLSDIYNNFKKSYSLFSVTDSLDACRRDLSDKPNMYTSKIAKMLTDYCLSIGANSFRDAYNIKGDMMDEKANGNKKYYDVDTEMTYRFIYCKNTHVISTNPDIDKFIDMMGWDDDTCKYTADSLAWEVMHDNEKYMSTSKNETSLFHFLYKLFRNGSIIQVYRTLTKMGIDYEVMISFNIDLHTKDMDYWTASNYNTVNAYKYMKNNGYDYDAVKSIEIKDLYSIFKK